MATDLEVFWDTVSHRRPSRVLYSFGLTPDLERRVKEHIGTENWGEYYATFMHAPNGLRRPANIPPLDFSKYWHGQTLPEGTVINDIGVAMAPGSLYHFQRRIAPLRNATSLKEIEEYPLEDMTKFDYSGVGAAIEKAHAQGKVVSGGGSGMYEKAWDIRGYEPFLMDMIERPAWAQCLLDRIAQENMYCAAQFAKAGVDLIPLGDDVANQKSMMFHPSMWREMIHSRWAKIWDAVHRINPKCQIEYHSDGNIMAAIPDMVDAGLNILNPLQPECLDIDKVYKDFGHILSFDGTIGTQSTMPWGTPQDVRSRVKEVIEKYGKNGGLFISPTHVLEPEVPLANIDALVAACKEFGGNG